jgi:hypothetical protein
VLPRLAVPAAALLLLLLSACSQGASGDDDGGPGEAPVPARQARTVTSPVLGACRLLTPADVAESTNVSPAVDCDQAHTAQTFAVGSFPEKIVDQGDEELGAYVFRTCDAKFRSFLGGDESLVLRSILTWAWFRAPDEVWDEGAHWYRCDVIGGGPQSEQLLNLPASAKGLLLGKPDDQWMVCAQGPTVAGSHKVPCAQPHDWRAVTTIKLGEPKDPYPGDRLVEVRTRDFCSDSVGAWMNYPVDYDFGYTYFHAAEWKAGNRRSICWAKTDQ